MQAVSTILYLCRVPLLQTVRSRLGWLLGVFSCMLVAASALAGVFSARQPAIVALDVGFSITRFMLLFLTLIWMQELFQKDLDRKTIGWQLAYPVGRVGYLLSKLLAMSVVLAAAALLFGVELYLVGSFSSWGYGGDARPTWGAWYPLSLLGLWAEALVILSFTLMVFSFSTTPFLAVAMGLLFSFSAKAIGVVVEYLFLQEDADMQVQIRWRPIVEVLRWVLPDLSTLDLRAGILYGNQDWTMVLPAFVMALGYCALFLTVACWQFARRELG